MKNADFAKLRMAVLGRAMTKARKAEDIDRFYDQISRTRNQWQLERALVRLGLVPQ